jgi:hypothetical protein
LFLQNIPNASENVRRRIVPSYLKKLYKMQDRRSTISQVSCIFSEGGNQVLQSKQPRSVKLLENVVRRNVL